jgi:BCD family chlorophyll transporter-like MFS transporter
MLSWGAIFRLGVVQTCIGSIIVLMTSTLNRIMVVELSLPAIVPGLLVGLHYVFQLTRPGWGHRSDTQGRRTPWIVGGMTVLASGGLLAAIAVALIPRSLAGGLALSVLAYIVIGIGVAVTGTSVLAFLAARTPPHRRAAAATIAWLMMIFGIAMTAGIVGRLLDPYSAQRLVLIVASIGVAAVLLSSLAVAGLERGIIPNPPEAQQRLRDGLREIMAEPHTRRFTQFVFLAMTAYFLQDLILEPYAGLAFGFTPGQSTSLSGVQAGSVFMGMLSIGVLVTGLGIGSLRNWVVAGCVGSSLALVGLAIIGPLGIQLLLPFVVALGFCNGVFAVAAIGAMMALAGKGRPGREGTRMGVWGAAQAVASGIGGLLGAAAVDLMRLALPVDLAFATVFSLQAFAFLLAAGMAYRVIDPSRDRALPQSLVPGVR